MTTPKNVMKMIKDSDVKYVDFRFTDPRGKWQHVTFDVSHDRGRDLRRRPDVRRLLDRRLEGDQRIRHVPDAGPGSACIDPFFAETTLVADLRRARADDRRALQPRSARHRQEGRGHGQVAWASATPSISAPRPSSSCSTTCSTRPSPTTPASSSTPIELPINSDTEYEGGNLGHRIGTKKGYFPVPPQDSAQDMRSEMLAAMARMGAKVEKHHHEVASAQHELGLKFSPLTVMADQHADLQILHPAGRPGLRQDRDLHAEAGLWRQRLGHALPPVDLEGRQAGVRRQQIRRSVGDLPVTTSPASSSTPRRSTPSPTRRPTPTSGWCRASRRRCCSPIRRATARPPAAFPTRPTRRPSASRCASPIRSPIPISPSRRC